MKKKVFFIYSLFLLNLSRVSASVILDTTTTSKNVTDATNCEELVGSSIVAFVKDLFDMIKWIALAIGLVLGMLDFFRAITSGEEGALKKSAAKFVKRLIGIVILFILPVVLEYILNISGVSHGGTCLNSNK